MGTGQQTDRDEQVRDEYFSGDRKSSPRRKNGPRTYRYYDFIMAAFVTILICSNLISAQKRVALDLAGYQFVFGAGVLFFPISYLFGDILTEVYGYARSRKVVWAGFTAIIFASAMSWVVVHLPADPKWKNQAAFETVFGNAPRIVLASIIAFFAGEFVKSNAQQRQRFPHLPLEATDLTWRVIHQPNSVDLAIRRP